MDNRKYSGRSKQKSANHKNISAGFPVEMWAEVIGYLDKKELREIAAVNRLFRALALSSMPKARWPQVDYRKFKKSYRFDDVLKVERCDFGMKQVYPFVLPSGDVVLGVQDGKFYLVKHGETVSRAFVGHEKRITHVVFIDENRLASASQDGTIRTWNRQDGSVSQIVKISSHQEAIAIDKLMLLANGYLVCLRNDEIIVCRRSQTSGNYENGENLAVNVSGEACSLVNVMTVDRDIIAEYRDHIVIWDGQSGKLKKSIQKEDLSRQLKAIINADLMQDQLDAIHFSSSDDVASESEDYTEKMPVYGKIDLHFDWKLSCGAVIITVNKFFYYVWDVRQAVFQPVFIGTRHTLIDAAACHDDLIVLQRSSTGYSVMANWNAADSTFHIQRQYQPLERISAGETILDSGVILFKSKTCFKITIFNPYTLNVTNINLQKPFKEDYLNQAFFNNANMKHLRNDNFLAYMHNNQIVIWDHHGGKILYNVQQSDWLDDRFYAVELAGGNIFGYSVNKKDEATIGSTSSVGVLHFGLFLPPVESQNTKKQGKKRLPPKRQVY